MEPYYLETDIEKIMHLSLLKKDENHRLKNFLKKRNPRKTELQIQRLYNEISPNIDCTNCGNCCRHLSPYLEPEDLKKLCTATRLEQEQVEKKYTETDAAGISFNSTPCPFLAENKCSVYPFRPGACASFPHLHQPGCNSRIRKILENYRVCPIIFNVIEKLKIEINFT